MSESRVTWVPVAIFAGGFEADVALARLESAGILAVRRDDDTVGIFGPGFQGPSARGVTVLVPSELRLRPEAFWRRSQDLPDVIPHTTIALRIVPASEDAQSGAPAEALEP